MPTATSTHPHVSLIPPPAPPAPIAGGLGCRDQSGSLVDWWFIYKLPNGVDYAYLDANSAAESKLAPMAGASLDEVRPQRKKATPIAIR